MSQDELAKRSLGPLEVTTIGIGCNNFGRRIDANITATVVHAALDAGINFFDTADVYGSGLSEEYLGKALGNRRADVLIATKFGFQVNDEYPGGATPAYIKRAVEASLTRLGTDYIDLYQLHRPDADTPVAETLGALNELVQAGKVRAIGASNFSPEQIREAEDAVQPGAARFVSIQNHYSLFHREPEQGVLAEAERLSIGILPYFPLANGLLTGKFRKGEPRPEGTRLSQGERADQLLSEHNLDIVEKLIAFAEAQGHTILELAFSWLLSRPTVSSVIAGATSAAQVQSNATAGGWQLTEADLATVDTILKG